jgi:hypothetical protein
VPTSAFSHIAGALLKPPRSQLKAGLGILTLLILILIPCAAVAVYRYGRMR